MHTQIFQRTSLGQAATCGRFALDPQALHLLMRFNGFTALEYLGQTGEDVAAFQRIAQQLLDQGLIEHVGEDPQVESPSGMGSCWGYLDQLVPA
ncbi:hypothetical protein [Sphaerotilus sp.]|uniref:hypothetical protein n=1 Tax=Sphaerotilus sp. TaxID=2093942 RepID=UPI0034E214E3